MEFTSRRLTSLSLAKSWKHLVVIALILLVSSLHYLTPVGLHYFHHAIYQRLYYMPILLGCYYFGLWGIGYALLSGLAYAPHIFFQWSSPHDIFTQYIEIFMFLVVGGLAGGLFSTLKRRQKQLLAQQENLRRAERLSLMGKLAAGLAHEIRNPLNSLLGAADIVRRALGEAHTDAEFARILESELRRVNRILDEFLAFARPRQPEFLPQNLNEVVEASLAVVAKTLQDAKVQVKERLSPELPLTPMDSELIKQVLLNLILNAKEAMPQGGAVTVETRHTGNELILHICDEGPGIAQQHIETIFDPFFTTKESGTGLGLAMSRQIAELHKGVLELKPQSNGTCLELRLPDGT